MGDKIRTWTKGKGGEYYTEHVLAPMPTVQVRYRNVDREGNLIDLAVNQFTSKVSLQDARIMAETFKSHLEKQGYHYNRQIIFDTHSLGVFDVPSQEVLFKFNNDDADLVKGLFLADAFLWSEKNGKIKRS